MTANGAKTTKVITGEVRFSYVHLLEAYSSFDGQDPKFSATLLIPKSDKKTLAAIKKAQEAAKEAGKAKFNGKIPAKLKTTLRDGDTDESVDPDENPEYAGNYFIRVSSKTKPGIVDADVNPIMDAGEIYSGMYGRASINFFAYNTAGNRGISAGLNNIQKTRDGAFLGGRSSADDDFSEWDSGEDEETDDMLG